MKTVTQNKGYNYINNGAMLVNQRGYTSTPTTIANTVYGVDQWKVFHAGTATLEYLTTGQPAELLPYSTASIKMIMTSADTSYFFFYQPQENPTSFAGKKVTFSAYVKSNRAMPLVLYADSTYYTGQAHTGDGTWQRLSITQTITTTLSYAAVGIEGATMSLQIGDYIETTGVQLELGAELTPFIPRDYFTELQKCLRFYWNPRNTTTKGHYVRSAIPVAGNNWFFYLTTPVPMRASPALVLNGGVLNTDYAVYSYAASPVAQTPTAGPTINNYDGYQLECYVAKTGGWGGLFDLTFHFLTNKPYFSAEI